MLIDTTLREGAQLFGAYFNLETRKRIASSSFPWELMR